MDPNGTGYWPRLATGVDTYTSVRFFQGRALRYTENLYPSLPAASALHVIGDELPPDAHVVTTRRARRLIRHALRWWRLARRCRPPLAWRCSLSCAAVAATMTAQR